MTGQDFFSMHANAKRGGGETAGHCGYDEGPESVQRLPETCVEVHFIF